MSSKRPGSPVIKRALVSRTLSSAVVPRRLVQAKLVSSSQTLSLPALVDSGADENFMDWQLAKWLRLNRLPLPNPLEVNTLDGRWLYQVTHRTQPIQITMTKDHTEFLSFYLVCSPPHSLRLGLPWLVSHNPQINWATGKIVSWNKSCSSVCFPTELAPAPLLSLSPLASKETKSPDLSGVPACYLDLKEVFNKTWASSLPPHRPYDCCINLLPGSSPPRGRLNSLSAPEREAMQTYINSSLEAGIIRPSSSPAGAGFFFVHKKDKSLRPCIDYRGLNEITF